MSQPPVRTFAVISSGTPVAYAQATVSGSAISLPSIPTGANRALVQLETGDTIRWRDDGTAPTSSVGMVLYPANIIELTSAQSIAKFKAIGIVGGGVTLNVSYYIK